MAGCGNCPDTCNCTVTAGANVVVTGDGSGTDPYVVTSSNPDWAGTSPDGSVSIGNLVPAEGHTPTLEVNIAPNGGLLTGGSGVQILVDPASTAPVSLGPGGLRIDCCDESGFAAATSDTDSVQMSLTAGLLEANVLPNALAGIEVLAAGVGIKLESDPAAVAPAGNNLARFTTAGDLTVPASLVQGAVAGLIAGTAGQDGSDATTLTSGAQVNLTTALGVTGANSFAITRTNVSGVPLLLRIEGIGTLEASSSGGNVSRVFAHQMALDATALAGGAVLVGNSGLGSVSHFDGSNGTIPASTKTRHRIPLAALVYLPPGASVTLAARATCLENQAGWVSTVAAGAFFQFVNIKQTVMRWKAGAAWGIV